MLHKTTMKFSHVKPGDTDFKQEGLRDFFKYRDLGVAEATTGKVLAQLVRSGNAPEKGTGWHYHGADFHIVYMLKGWQTMWIEGHGVVTMREGSSWTQPPGILHEVLDYSDDREVVEIIMPAKFDTIDADKPDA